MPEIVKINPESFNERELNSAVTCLQNGELLVYPTETVYGIGADIENEEAISKVYSVKRRDSNKPALCIASSTDMIRKYVREINYYAKVLIQQYWPGPLTIAFNASKSAPETITGNNTIAFRVPSSKICLKLVALHGNPILSTSANLAGAKPAISIDDLSPQIKERVSVILDSGETNMQQPSTIVDVSSDKPVLIREGVLRKLVIEKETGMQLVIHAKRE